jgi:competence protein ComEA
VTPVVQTTARPRTWTSAQATAAACVGLALLAGTGISGLGRSGPAFPPAQPLVPPSVHGNVEPASPDGRSEPERSAGHGDVGSEREPGTPAQSAVLDINEADAVALQTLPGVGPTLARRIVEHRALHGPFRTPGDLLQVTGIGAKRYAQLQGRIRTAGAP